MTTETPNELTLLSRPQAAKLMGISIDLLNSLVATGKLKFILVGKRVKIPYLAIREYILNNMTDVKRSDDEIIQINDIVIENSNDRRVYSSFDSEKYLEEIREAING
jgi:excisionase family DNA binding protein